MRPSRAWRVSTWSTSCSRSPHRSAHSSHRSDIGLSVRRVVGEDAIATEVEWVATNSGPLAIGGDELPATNKQVTGRGSYMWRARGGKIVEFHSHPDVAGIMMQLGLMPAG